MNKREREVLEEVEDYLAGKCDDNFRKGNMSNAIDCGLLNDVREVLIADKDAKELEKQKKKPVTKVRTAKVMTAKQVAKLIDQGAQEWEEHGKNNFANDKHMLKCYASDAEDLRSIASSLRSGNFYRAATKAYGLDTIVREQIPSGVWNYICDRDEKEARDLEK